MSRRAFALFFALSLTGKAFAKCGSPDDHKLAWTRTILEKTLPKGVTVFDHVWLKNPTATEFITYAREKGAEARTGYREILGNVPTTKDELPVMKLVNGERYEYSFPENPTYGDPESEIRTANRAGWAHQDYPAGLIQPSTPIIPDQLIERIFSGKTKVLAVKVPVDYYYGAKRGQIEVVFEFTKNPKYGVIDPGCPAPSPHPSVSPSAGL